MATRYLTVANLKLWMRSEIPTADDTFLDQAIQAAETTLDNACGRRFEVASTTSARVYDAPPCSPWLVIHDCTAVTAVVDFTTTLTVDLGYKLYPLNGIDVSGEAVPYNMIARCTSGYFYNWYNYAKPGTISVTATWGWAAIPPQIMEACKIIAKDEFNQRDSGVGFGLVGISEAGGVGSRENMIVRKAVSNYRHPNGVGIG